MAEGTGDDRQVFEGVSVQNPDVVLITHPLGGDDRPGEFARRAVADDALARAFALRGVTLRLKACAPGAVKLKTTPERTPKTGMVDCPPWMVWTP